MSQTYKEIQHGQIVHSNHNAKRLQSTQLQDQLDATDHKQQANQGSDNKEVQQRRMPDK